MANAYHNGKNVSSKIDSIVLPVLPSGSDQIFLNKRIFGMLTGTRISSFFLTFLDAVYFNRLVVSCTCGYLVTF